MNSLLRRLADYRPFTAIVVGDFMLDQHVHGAAERLSPDAPVPVLHATRMEDRPGGAANVSLCLLALKARVRCYGVTGADREGELLKQALADAGCATAGLLADPTRPTTIKRSLIGLAQHRHPQKMFRVDVESRDPLSNEMTESLLRAIEADLDDADVVCIEDYNKGVCTFGLCTRLIELCRRRGKPILVDPAAIADYTKYRRATSITPNRSEAELATGLDTPIEASAEHNTLMATRLLELLELESVVLTLDRHGALLALPDKAPEHVPTVARSVYDVTGAGDMILAALAGAVANRFDWIDAVKFANAAAGLEVEVFGCAPIPFTSVQREVLAQQRGFDGKVRTLEELLIELAVHREAGRTIVLTNGCFDVIHAGHVSYLRGAKALGDVLVVAINADEEVRSQKGEGRPVFGERERLEILQEFQCIDYLLVFGEPTAHRLIESIRPHVYVKGGDYAPEDVNEYDLIARLTQEEGLVFKTIAWRPGLSTTDVIERLGRASAGVEAGTRK